jgi:hypothetical protein
VAGSRGVRRWWHSREVTAPRGDRENPRILCLAFGSCWGCARRKRRIGPVGAASSAGWTSLVHEWDRRGSTGSIATGADEDAPEARLLAHGVILPDWRLAGSGGHVFRGTPQLFVDGLDARSIHSEEFAPEQIEPPAQDDELPEHGPKSGAIAAAEIGDRFEIRLQASQQPDQLDVAVSNAIRVRSGHCGMAIFIGVRRIFYVRNSYRLCGKS